MNSELKSRIENDPIYFEHKRFEDLSPDEYKQYAIFALETLCEGEPLIIQSQTNTAIGWILCPYVWDTTA